MMHSTMIDMTCRSMERGGIWLGWMWGVGLKKVFFSDVHLELGYEDCNHFHFIFRTDLFWQLVCIWTQNVSKLLKYELSVTGMHGMAVIYNILLTSQMKRSIGLK